MRATISHAREMHSIYTAGATPNIPGVDGDDGDAENGWRQTTAHKVK